MYAQLRARLTRNVDEREHPPKETNAPPAKAAPVE
jgi:hypothetical protein